MSDLSSKYRVNIVKCDEDEGGFMAIVPELPGCMSDGDTVEEAYSNAQDAIDAWIEVAKRHGKNIPLPDKDDEDYSGRILLRISKNLHKQLVESAKKQGVSLNLLLNEYLANQLGREANASPTPPTKVDISMKVDVELSDYQSTQTGNSYSSRLEGLRLLSGADYQ